MDEEYCPICFSTDGHDYDTSTNEVTCLNCGERWQADDDPVLKEYIPAKDALDEF